MNLHIKGGDAFAAWCCCSSTGAHVVLLTLGLGGLEEGAAPPLKRTMSTVPLLYSTAPLATPVPSSFLPELKREIWYKPLMLALLQLFDFVDKGNEQRY